MSTTTEGPNVRKLIIHKMSLDAIPKGGGMADGLRFLSDPKRIGDSARAATDWVAEAIMAVRQASEPNRWKDAGDEAIAGEILRGIEERKAKRP